MVKAAVLALVIGAVCVVAVRWGSFVAGGSDSSCYLTQAVRWAALMAHPASATLQAPDPLALAAPWPDATLTFTPTGHVPSRTVPGAFVPVCAAGLSIAMAPMFLAGGAAWMFAVVPLFGVLLILATYSVGSRFGSRVGVASAVLVAASPVFLLQVVQPMSDVPAAALWVTAIAQATATKRRSAAWAGVATSAALLMRPNLLPLGFVIGLFLLFRPERSWRQRLQAGLTYAAWCVPGCVAVAVIQRYFYGSPFASGYGAFDALFAFGHVVPNLQRYTSWLWTACTPAILLAALALFLLPGALTRLLLTMFVVNLAMFLPYVVFDDRSFLRFLLPTLPLLLVLVAAAVDAIVVRSAARRTVPVGRLSLFGRAAGRSEQQDRPYRYRDGILLLVTIAVALLFLRQARAMHVFDLARYESRFERAGRFVAARLPANALVITDYESASVRFYSGRPTLVWGALDPAWLKDAVTFARRHGFEPYLLFERSEEEPFRRRFASSSPIGALDWPPMAEVAAQVFVYRVADRELYEAGVSISTEYTK